jgi:hypothetical protein
MKKLIHMNKMIPRKRGDLIQKNETLKFNKIIILFFLFTGIISLCSCEKNVTVDIPQAESKLVVEGYVENGKFPYVILSKTLPFFGSVNTENVTQNTVQNAVITISNGITTVTLTQLPGYGIYYTTSPDMIGVAGKSYSLKVVSDGTILTAITSIPPAVPLDSAWFKIDGNRDSLGFIWAHLHDPDTLGNNYRWFAQRINHYTYGLETGQMKDTTFVTPRGSVFEDKFFNAKSFDFGYNRGSLPNSDKEDDNNDERNFFKRGDTIVIKFASIDRAHFEFWRTEETQAGSNGNPFGSPAFVTSNINGGLGIWGGYNSTYDTVIAR